MMMTVLCSDETAWKILHIFKSSMWKSSCRFSAITIYKTSVWVRLLSIKLYVISPPHSLCPPPLQSPSSVCPSLSLSTVQLQGLGALGVLTGLSLMLSDWWETCDSQKKFWSWFSQPASIHKHTNTHIYTVSMWARIRSCAIAQRQMRAHTLKWVLHTCRCTQSNTLRPTHTHTCTHTLGSPSWHPQSVTAKTQRTSSWSQEGWDSTLSYTEFELINTGNDRLPAMTDIFFFTFTYFTVEDISFLWLEAWRGESVLLGKYGSCLITRRGTEVWVWMDRQPWVMQPYLLTIITWTIKIFIINCFLSGSEKLQEIFYCHSRSTLWATTSCKMVKNNNNKSKLWALITCSHKATEQKNGAWSWCIQESMNLW